MALCYNVVFSPLSAFLLLFLRHIAELIFYMEELRAHVRKYGPVMQRYYVQYLSGFDAVVLNELVQVSSYGFAIKILLISQLLTKH